MEVHHFTCPACGFLVFDEPPGSYAICHICGWEDDHVQLRFPLLQGGANTESLVEHQINVLMQIPVDITEYQGYLRDPDWRPLGEIDVQSNEGLPETGHDYFHAAKEDSSSYYWKTKPK
jgi:hypothetical protein